MKTTTIRSRDVYPLILPSGEVEKTTLMKAFDELTEVPHGELNVKLIRIGRALDAIIEDTAAAIRGNQKSFGLKPGKAVPDVAQEKFEQILDAEHEVEAILYSEIPDPKKLPPRILIKLGRLLDFDVPGPEEAGAESAG